MPTNLAPQDVFVPGKFPVEKTNAYADRGAPQDDARRALERCYVPLVFGGYGVGKSSMVAKLARELFPDARVVYIENVYGKSLEDIFKVILESIDYEVTVQRSTGSGQQVSAAVESQVAGGVFGVLTAKLKGRVGAESHESKTRVVEMVVTSPTESKLLDVCEQHGILLIIDELHRASPILTETMSAFLKAYANKNCRQFRVALLGTEDDASRLVISDPGIDRLLEEIQLPPLSRSEAQDIIETGFRRLEMEVEPDAKEALVTYSVGSPFVLQFLCLEVAETSARESGRVITRSDVSSALDAYARRKAQRLIRTYRAGVETTGPKRYRKQILIAMANSPDEYVTMEYLVENISAALRQAVPSTTLSGPLRDLKTERFGQILRDVDNPAGGGRLGNYSAFSDPGMKAIIRMVEAGGIDAT